MTKKRPEGTHTYDFRGRFEDQYDFDGTTVGDALDYYVPEWRHVTGRTIVLAVGHTDLGMNLRVYIPRGRECIVRWTYDDDPCGLRVSTTVLPDDSKQLVTMLLRDDDRLDDECTDKRFIMMVNDIHDASVRE